MAAVTLNRRRVAVFGNKRIVTADISIANTGDTYNTGLKFIDSASVDGGSAAVNSFTKSGGTLTLATGGAVTNALVIAIGT